MEGIIKQVALDTLKDLGNGIVNVAYARELGRLVDDCKDRPGDTTARTLTLELKLTPVIAEDGTCDGAKGIFKVKSKVPERVSKSYDFGVRKGGKLVFNAESPADFGQTTLGEADEEGTVRRAK